MPYSCSRLFQTIGLLILQQNEHSYSYKILKYRKYRVKMCKMLKYSNQSLNRDGLGQEHPPKAINILHRYIFLSLTIHTLMPLIEEIPILFFNCRWFLLIINCELCLYCLLCLCYLFLRI